eukprot:5809937-Amphidinium_carterae.1
MRNRRRLERQASAKTRSRIYGRLGESETTHDTFVRIIPLSNLQLEIYALVAGRCVVDLNILETCTDVDVCCKVQDEVRDIVQAQDEDSVALKTRAL